MSEHRTHDSRTSDTPEGDARVWTTLRAPVRVVDQASGEVLLEVDGDEDSAVLRLEGAGGTIRLEATGRAARVDVRHRDGASVDLAADQTARVALLWGEGPEFRLAAALPSGHGYELTGDLATAEPGSAARWCQVQPLGTKTLVDGALRRLAGAFAEALRERGQQELADALLAALAVQDEAPASGAEEGR